MSNAPSTLFGLMPLARAVVRSATDATATTVTEDDSGTVFVNLSTSSHAYTLPLASVGAGKCYIFFNGQTSESFVVTAASSEDSLMGVDDVAADTITSPAEVGAFAIVIGDGTDWFALCGPGTYTAA